MHKPEGGPALRVRQCRTALPGRLGRLTARKGCPTVSEFVIQTNQPTVLRICLRPSVSRNRWRDLLLRTSRGDKIPFELSVAAIRGWDAGLRRRLDDGTSSPDETSFSRRAQ